MSRVWDQDAFSYVRADKISNPLATADPGRFVRQSHKLVRVTLDRIRDDFTSLRDRDGYGTVGT